MIRRAIGSRTRWYGFDIDGTIADNSLHSWVIDKPIKPMVALMKRLHREGYDVRILSGRLGDFTSDDQVPEGVKLHIWKWCDRHLGFRPQLTGRKDSLMETLFDDRACQVVCNKGITLESLNGELAGCLEALLDEVGGKVKDKALLARCRKALKNSEG